MIGVGGKMRRGYVTAAPQMMTYGAVEIDEVNAFGQVVERDFVGVAPQVTYAAAPQVTYGGGAVQTMGAVQTVGAGYGGGMATYGGGAYLRLLIMEALFSTSTGVSTGF